MNEQQIGEYLNEIITRRGGQALHFERLVVSRAATYVELELPHLRAEWPDRELNTTLDGGCDSCGWGERILLAVSGTALWDGASA